MKKLNKNNKGFSLVELLVVIAIMVVLVGVIAPTLLSNIEKARVSSDIQALDSVASAVQNTLGDEKAYDAITKDTAILASTYIGSGASATDNFAIVIADYLAKVPDMKGSTAKSDGKGVYFAVTSKGQVKVWLSTVDTGVTVPADAPADKTEANTDEVIFDKNTAYYVER